MVGHKGTDIFLQFIISPAIKTFIITGFMIRTPLRRPFKWMLAWKPGLYLADGQ
jgi:hypothetical protein